MRIRNIRPEITTHEDLADLPREVRLCFIYLWMALDREGRAEDRPRRLRADLFPHDEDVTADVLDGWLGTLAAAGFVVRYEVDGARYLAVPSFPRHQALSTWERTKTKSEIPPPPPALRKLSRMPTGGQQEDYGSPSVELQKTSGSRPVALLPDVGRMTKDEGQDPPPPPTAGAAGKPAPEPLAVEPEVPDPDRVTPEALAQRWNRDVADGKAKGAVRLPLGKQRRKAELRIKARPRWSDWDPALAYARRLRAEGGCTWLDFAWLVANDENADAMLGGKYDFKLEQAARSGPRLVGGIAPPPPEELAGDAPEPGQTQAQRCAWCRATLPHRWDGHGWWPAYHEGCSSPHATSLRARDLADELAADAAFAAAEAAP